MRNSSTSPKQQWQPLPSLLSLSVFHAGKHPFISNTHHKHTFQRTNVISFRINIKSQRDPEFTYHLMEQGCTLYSVHRLRLKFSFSMTRVQIISLYFQSIEVIPVDNSFSCWIPRKTYRSIPIIRSFTIFDIANMLSWLGHFFRMQNEVAECKKNLN